MDWILLEKEKPVEFGMYLICYEDNQKNIVGVDEWNFSTVVIKEDYDMRYCKKLWSFRNPNIKWWAKMPKSPKDSR